MQKKYLYLIMTFMLFSFGKLSAQCPTLIFGAPTINNATCTSTNPTGSITTKVTSGTPVKWQLLNFTTLAVIQTFNSSATTFTFSNVPSGNYKVKVIDGCNFELTQDITITYYPSISSTNFQMFSIQTNAYGGTCGNETDYIDVNFGDSNTSNGIAYPLTVEVTVHLPSGGTQVLSQTFNTPPSPVGSTNTTDNSGRAMHIPFELPLIKNSIYSYDVKITDACGTVKTLMNRPLDTNSVGTATTLPSTVACATSFPINIKARNFRYNGNVKATISSFNGSTSGFPVGTSIALTNSILTSPNSNCCFANYDLMFNGNFPDLPIGNYTITVSDDCGNINTFPFNHNPVVTYDISVRPFASCGLGSTDLVYVQAREIIGSSSNFINMNSARIISAPAGSGMTLPFDVSSYIMNVPSKILIIPGTVFPISGTYTIEVTNTCGVTRSATVDIGKYLPTYDATIVRGCNIFSIAMAFKNVKSGQYYPATNSVNEHQFLLQFFNPIANRWEHPTTGSATSNNSAIPVDAGNGQVLINNITNNSWAKSGKYRIVDIYNSSLQATPQYCLVVAKEFDIDFNISFNYYVVQCTDGSYNLLASASGGNGNFTFNLYDSTHTTIIATNSTGIFTNIANGNYLLDITDTCPNALLNQPISIPGSASPIAITVVGNPCYTGNNITLSVPKINGITYRWFKTSAPATTLSTNNEYNFIANPPSTTTTYSVQLTYTADPTNCINRTISYTVDCTAFGCFKPGATVGTALDTKHGITSLGRAGTNNGNWPMVRKGAWTVLEAKTKGFVVNRLSDSEIAAIQPANLVEGMMVYNTTKQCLMINTNGTSSGWKCYISPACPD